MTLSTRLPVGTDAGTDPGAGADAGQRSRLFWGAATWTILAVALAALALLAFAPELYRQGGEALARPAQPLLGLYERAVPASLGPFFEGGARLLLTPWLYLVMALVFAAEKYVPARREQRVFSVALVQDSLGWFLLDGVTRTILVGGYVAFLYSVYERFLGSLPVWPDANPALRVALAVVVMDFLNWLHHWVRHKVRVFWVFHRVHHSQREMNMFTDRRAHVVELLVAWPIYYLPLFVLHLDVELALWITVFRVAYTQVYHANLRTSYGPLKYLLVTPQSHRIHHSSDPRHADRNFGVLFSVWDHLFGTQWRDYDEYPDTGIEDAGFPMERSVRGIGVVTNYFQQVAYPFRVLFGALRGRGWQLAPDPQARRASPR